jgi:hypothetical protein|tara:strand:+ start:32 stop:235 length:204 start_codon:yes stop_codon:yes gene_type:complete
MTSAAIYRTTCVICELITNKFNTILKSMVRSFEIAGYAKAASELARMGYHAESKALMLSLAKLRAAK